MSVALDKYEVFDGVCHVDGFLKLKTHQISNQVGIELSNLGSQILNCFLFVSNQKHCFKFSQTINNLFAPKHNFLVPKINETTMKTTIKTWLVKVVLMFLHITSPGTVAFLSEPLLRTVTHYNNFKLRLPLYSWFHFNSGLYVY